MENLLINWESGRGLDHQKYVSPIDVDLSNCKTAKEKIVAISNAVKEQANTNGFAFTITGVSKL